MYVCICACVPKCGARLGRLVSSTKNKYKIDLCPLLEVMGNMVLKINMKLNSLYIQEFRIPPRHQIIHIFSFPVSLARDAC